MTIHRDPKIININADKPKYDDFQKQCSANKPDNPGNIPIYIQATKIPSKDNKANWKCNSLYDGAVYDLKYQPWKESSRDDWACCAYNLTSNSGKQEVLFLPKSMRGSDKNILSVYTLEAKLIGYKKTLKEIEVNLKDARDSDNSCTNLCGDRKLHINDIPILNPLNEGNNYSYKPTRCSDPKGSTATQLNHAFNINNNYLYNISTLSTDPKSLVCCGKTEEETYWIPTSKLGNNTSPTTPIPGFFTKTDIKQCSSVTSTISKLEFKQKSYIEKINAITSQLVKIGKTVGDESDVYDSCNNYIQSSVNYTDIYTNLTHENKKIRTLMDDIRKIEVGTNIDKLGIDAGIYHYVIYLILSLLLVSICAILLIPALQKMLGINIKEMVNVQKNALKRRMGRK